MVRYCTPATCRDPRCPNYQAAGQWADFGTYFGLESAVDVAAFLRTQGYETRTTNVAGKWHVEFRAEGGAAL